MNRPPSAELSRVKFKLQDDAIVNSSRKFVILTPPPGEDDIRQEPRPTPNHTRADKPRQVRRHRKRVPQEVRNNIQRLDQPLPARRRRHRHERCAAQETPRTPRGRDRAKHVPHSNGRRVLERRMFSHAPVRRRMITNASFIHEPGVICSYNVPAPTGTGMQRPHLITWQPLPQPNRFPQMRLELRDFALQILY